MQKLEDKIEQVLQTHPFGLRAKEIAFIIGEECSSVNSCLYKNADKFIKVTPKPPLWKLKMHVLRKLQNRKGARLYSQQQFDAIVDSSAEHAFIGGSPYITKRGKVINCDSESEVQMLKYLEDNDLVHDLGNLKSCIAYGSYFQTGLSYYPDIVALTKDNHIAIFEVKSAGAMDNHMTMQKYRALELYCKEHGYMYGMLDPKEDYLSFEEIKGMEVNGLLRMELNAWIDGEVNTGNAYARFDKTDVNNWYRLFGSSYTKKQFNLQVHSLVMRYGWYNTFKNGFMVYSRPVKLDAEHNVIEVR